MEPAQKKDFFISYTGADRQWAEWIAWQLEANGFTTVIQAWDFGAGSNFVAAMEVAAKNAERTLAVLSPEYQRSGFASAEWQAAFRDDPQGLQRRLLPVRVKDYNVEGLLGSVVYVDLVGLDYEQAREHLLARARRARAKPQQEPDFPGSTATAPALGVDVGPEPRFPGTEIGSGAPHRQRSSHPAHASAASTGNSRPARHWPVWATILAILGLAATLGAWLWPRAPEVTIEGPPEVALYSLRIQTLAPDGNPVAIETIRVSAGNEPQRLPDGWWEVEIPAAKLPHDRKITVWAESDKWATGRENLTLEMDPNPSLEIRMGPAQSWIGGRVLDPGGAPLPGSKVTAVNSTTEPVVTDANGGFELVLPVPRDTRIRLHAEATGFAATDTFCYTGLETCTIQLANP